jgi:hypothetical protein
MRTYWVGTEVDHFLEKQAQLDPVCTHEDSDEETDHLVANDLDKNYSTCDESEDVLLDKAHQKTRSQEDGNSSPVTSEPGTPSSHHRLETQRDHFIRVHCTDDPDKHNALVQMDGNVSIVHSSGSSPDIQHLYAS